MSDCPQSKTVTFILPCSTVFAIMNGEPGYGRVRALFESSEWSHSIGQDAWLYSGDLAPLVAALTQLCLMAQEANPNE